MTSVWVHSQMTSVWANSHTTSVWAHSQMTSVLAHRLITTLWVHSQMTSVWVHHLRTTLWAHSFITSVWAHCLMTFHWSTVSGTTAAAKSKCAPRAREYVCHVSICSREFVTYTVSHCSCKPLQFIMLLIDPMTDMIRWNRPSLPRIFIITEAAWINNSFDVWELIKCFRWHPEMIFLNECEDKAE